MIILLMERKRKTVSYRIDSLIIEALKEIAKEDNNSVNKWLETHLLYFLKQKGFLSPDTKPLGETRGGDMKSGKTITSSVKEQGVSNKQQNQAEEDEGEWIEVDIPSDKEIEQAEKLRKELIAAEKARVKRRREQFIDALLAEGIDQGEVHRYMYQFDPYEDAYPDENQ